MHATFEAPADAASPFVLIGRRVPWRGIWSSVIITVVLIGGFGVFALTGRHPENAPLLLLFLLLPVIAIPALIGLNQYAVIDRRDWSISVNGSVPRPLAQLTFCKTGTFRGVCTLTLGFSDRRRDGFSVSSHTPFGSPRIERDWVRYLLPYTGLPRDSARRLSVVASIAGDRAATLEQAQQFAHEELR